MGASSAKLFGRCGDGACSGGGWAQDEKDAIGPGPGALAPSAQSTVSVGYLSMPGPKQASAVDLFEFLIAVEVDCVRGGSGRKL